MNKSALFCLLLVMSANAHEHRVRHLDTPRPQRPIQRSPEMEFHPDVLQVNIDILDRPRNPAPTPPISPTSRRLKLKLVALTAIITTIITGGVSIIINWKKCE